MGVTAPGTMDDQYGEQESCMMIRMHAASCVRLSTSRSALDSVGPSARILDRLVVAGLAANGFCPAFTRKVLASKSGGPRVSRFNKCLTGAAEMSEAVQPMSVRSTKADHD